MGYVYPDRDLLRIVWRGRVLGAPLQRFGECCGADRGAGFALVAQP